MGGKIIPNAEQINCYAPPVTVNLRNANFNSRQAAQGSLLIVKIFLNQ
jgi:hypothetical protein